MILQVIDEAMKAGASQASACDVAGLDVRTVQRWRGRPDGDDLRQGPHTAPSNKFTADEEAKIVELVTSPEFVGLSPHQLVAKLADMSIYVASEATIYRLLRRRQLLAHRDRTRPRKNHRPREHVATGPNQVWAWDITYLPAGVVRGTFWYLYAIIDVWSRKVVGWRVHEVQSDDLAAALIDDTCRHEGVVRDQLVLHADNGSAMKGSRAA
jgi:putative transposase